MSYPLQPLVTVDGVLRFKENGLVQHLLKHGGLTLNDLAQLDVPDEDRAQFAQLIGYSLSGFGELSYVSDELYAVASDVHKGLTEEQGRINYLHATLEAVKKGLRDIVPAVFRIAEEDLQD
jgi:hypothetical protein